MNRKLKTLLVLLCTMALMCAFAGTALADVGGFSGGSDFGGGFSGGSGGDSDAELIGDLIYLLLWLIIDVPGGWIIALIIIGVLGIFGVWGAVSDKKSEKSSKKRNRVIVEDTFDTSKLMDMGYYKDVDPNFNSHELCNEAADLYVKMQQAWTAKNFEVMRPHFSDTMFGQLDRQLDSLKNRNQTNYVDDIAVLGVTIEGWYQEKGQDCISLKLRTRIVDYTLDDSTGRLISGSKTDQKYMTYRWVMTRTTGFKTAVEGEMQIVSCPNCGAALQINQTARCPYCDSIVTLEKHDWVINAMQGLSQTTR